MRIGSISLLFLVFLVHKLVRCGRVKRQIFIPSKTTCMNTKENEYSIAKQFYKQFNQNNKFTDTFNTTNYLPTKWLAYRTAEPWNIDPTTGLLIPIEIFSKSNSTIFVTIIKNDLSYTFQVYFIGYGGVPTLYSTLTPGSTFYVGKSVFVGNTWFLKNLNTSQVLVFRCGESPFLTSNVTYGISQIKKTNYDYIRKPYIFYVDNTPNSGPVFVPSGVVSTTNGSAFTFTLNNDLSDSYSAYLIDGSGNAIFYNNIDSGTTSTIDSSFGFIWFLKNNNPNTQETLYVKLGEVPFTNSGVVVNLSDILSTVEDIVPLATILPYLSHQGSVGDCYLLHVIISILSRYPQKLTGRFLYPSQFRKTGAVILKLWNTLKSCWTPLVLDDYFPRSGASFYGVSSSDYFNEFWVSFLEKAFAKNYGGYPNISTSFKSPTEKTIYQALIGPNMTYSSIYYTYDNPAMFKTILPLYKSGAVIAFASRDCNASGSYTGLSCYHGYGLLDLQENVAGTNFTFLKLQNTYGSGGESNLTWSDTSSSWDQYPDVKAALKPQNINDGIFWVEKSDLSKAFETFYAAKF